MEKVFFTILLVFLGFGVLFGSYKFFEDPKIQTTTKRGNSLDAIRLALGDRRISSRPQKDYVISCRNGFRHGGAFRDGNWIHSDGTRDSTAKVEVNGDLGSDGKLINIYHYHATKEYPYTIDCFKGTPVMGQNMRPSRPFPPPF
jgi:hypothetical protein